MSKIKVLAGLQSFMEAPRENLVFFFLAMPHSMQELISQTGVLNPCSLQWKCRVLIIGREVPNKGGFKKNFVCLFIFGCTGSSYLSEGLL